MRKTPWIWCLLFVVGAVGYTSAQRGADAAPKVETFAGTWSGTWEDAGSGSSGGFDLTLEQGKDGPMTGKVSVTGEPTYKAVFKSLSFDGKKMSAKYDFPPDESAEILLAASFEGNTATGTWSAALKGTDSQIASGTWKVARKLP
jgi:hypothetical protein